MIKAHNSPDLPGSGNPATSASQVGGNYRYMASHPAKICVFFVVVVVLVETGFCHVGQTGLELLTSGDPYALASQSAGITGISPHLFFFNAMIPC